jgi:hypothetical protein
MRLKTDARTARARRGERGDTRLNFILILLVLAVAAYAAYQLVPIMYNASLYKVHMQDTVDKAVALGKDDAWVRQQLVRNAEDYGVPGDQRVDTHLSDGRMVLRVRWARPVSLPGYTYDYNFDHTVKTAKFLNTQ